MQEFLHTRRLFLVVVTLGLFVMATRSVTDPDVWWHLRTGQLILQQHHVFHTDPYSFTKSGQPWVDHEWLSQVFLLALYRLAGWPGLILTFAGLIATAFLIVFFRSPGRPYIAGMVTVCAALASAPCWGVRPQVLTLLLASLLLLLLERSYEHPSLLWWTPALFLLWVNLHAGYAVGIAILVMFWIGDGLDLMFGLTESHDSTARFRRLGLVIAMCLAVIPLNPNGFRMYWYPLQTLHSRAMQAYIGEWLSPDFHQPIYLPTLLLILVTLALPALSPRRLRPRELLLLAVTGYAALRSVRHVPIYVLVAAPLISAMIQGVLGGTGWERWFRSAPRPLTWTKQLVNGILLAGILIFSTVRIRQVIAGQAASEARAFPAAAALFLATAQPPGPLMNHYNWGGYFIWKLYPQYRVYIDGRADLYGDEFMDNFASIFYVKGNAWRTAVEAWGIRTIVLPPDTPLIAALRLTPGWTVVFSDDQAVVLSRTK